MCVRDERNPERLGVFKEACFRDVPFANRLLEKRYGALPWRKENNGKKIGLQFAKNGYCYQPRHRRVN